MGNDGGTKLSVIITLLAVVATCIMLSGVWFVTGKAVEQIVKSEEQNNREYKVCDVSNCKSVEGMDTYTYVYTNKGSFKLWKTSSLIDIYKNKSNISPDVFEQNQCYLFDYNENIVSKQEMGFCTKK